MARFPPMDPSFWNRRYAESEFAYGTEPNDFLVRVVDRIPPGRVLCLAEGQGRNAVFLAEKGFEVTAVDASDVGLERARQLASARSVHIETRVADLADFDLGKAAWDGIVSIFAHLPPNVRRDVHRRVVAGLRPGGVFVLEAYTPAQLERKTGGPPVAELMMEKQALESELTGLIFSVFREQTRPVHEGSYHQGLGEVVQVLACKPA